MVANDYVTWTMVLDGAAGVGASEGADAIGAPVAVVRS